MNGRVRDFCSRDVISLPGGDAMHSTFGCENLVYSRLADDPDIGEIIQEFVDEMPSRIESLTEAFNLRDWTTVRKLAHQLKGAGGGYGFDELTSYAKGLENAVHNCLPEDSIAACFHALIDYCQRVRSGCPI